MWPGGKDLLGKKHRPGWPSSRRLGPASAGCGGPIGRPDFGDLSRAAGRPYPEKTLYIYGSTGWPAWSMKWKPPHSFCPEGPCPRAWHSVENHLSVAPFQSALSGSLFFIPPVLPEVMIWVLPGPIAFLSAFLVTGPLLRPLSAAGPKNPRIPSPEPWHACKRDAGHALR